MANTYATKLAEGFAQRVMQIYYQNAVTEAITNSDYEGEVRDRLSKLNILTFSALTLQNYTGTALTASNPSESVGVLNTDQQKAFYFKIQSLSRFKSWIKNPENTLLDQLGKELKKTVDGYTLGLYTKAAAGQRVGTDYTTGTVAVATGTGVVTGTGTTFTAAMVGKPFKAAGHTSWYTVSVYTSATQITIVDDLDDAGTGAYTGGTISAGATYTVQAASAFQLTKSNFFANVIALKIKLDAAQIPSDDRFLVMPSVLANLALSAPELIPAVNIAYENKVMNGLIGRIAGFNVYMNEQVATDGSTGFHVLAGHKSAIAFAMGFTESGIEDLIGDFGKAYKGLNVYGAKVVDERRKALAELYVTA